jgi:hypothetical protein
MKYVVGLVIVVEELKVELELSYNVRVYYLLLLLFPLLRELQEMQEYE